MDSDSRFLNDLHLCQDCLEGDSAAITRLREDCGARVRAYLSAAGATPAEVDETVDSLWADLLVATPPKSPKLCSYRGDCSLQTWLNTVALNRLLTRKRGEERWQKIAPIALDSAKESEAFLERSPAWLADPESAKATDVVLIDLVREAIEFAFGGCEPEDFVLLQLKYLDGLRGAELARMFHCDEPAVSRRLGRAGSHIETATLNYIRKTDPWLELKWPDFVELCQTATPGCFGLD